MTVQELIENLSRYDSQMKVAIKDEYEDTAQHISGIYEDTIDKYSEEYVVFLERGGML